jgi:hypothetical protein
MEMISVGGKPMTAQLRKRTRADLRTFLLPYDVNYPEAIQIQKEFEAGLFCNPLVPVTRRYPPRDQHGKVIRQAAATYGLRVDAVQARYVNILTDGAKVECYGIGVKVGAKELFLILND